LIREYANKRTTLPQWLPTTAITLLCADSAILGLVSAQGRPAGSLPPTPMRIVQLIGRAAAEPHVKRSWPLAVVPSASNNTAVDFFSRSADARRTSRVALRKLLTGNGCMVGRVWSGPAQRTLT